MECPIRGKPPVTGHSALETSLLLITAFCSSALWYIGKTCVRKGRSKVSNRGSHTFSNEPNFFKNRGSHTFSEVQNFSKK